MSESDLSLLSRRDSTETTLVYVYSIGTGGAGMCVVPLWYESIAMPTDMPMGMVWV